MLQKVHGDCWKMEANPFIEDLKCSQIEELSEDIDD